MAKGFFVTGTDTGVGKTVISAALVRLLKGVGLSVCAMKPIESGCMRKGDVLVPADGALLRTMAGMEEDISVVTPYALEAPLAPMVAAEREGVRIEPERIKKIFDGLAKRYDAAIVEGVGGLLVPIRRDFYVLDLAGELGLPLVVVARPGLGTINHTLLTVRCALDSGVQVAGVVINRLGPADGDQDPSWPTNPEVIRELSGVPLIGIFPYLKDISGPALEKTARENLDLLRSYRPLPPPPPMPE